MNIFVIADRQIESLFPDERILEQPILPLGGRPLLERVLTVLASQLDEVSVILPDAFTETKKWLSANAYPPLKIHLTTPQNVVIAEPTLFIRGDIMMSPGRLADSVASWRRADNSIDEPPMGDICIIHPGDSLPTWQSYRAHLQKDMHAKGLLSRNAFLTPDHYHGVLIAAAANRLPGVLPAGWLDADGLRIGLDARIQTRLAPGNGSTIGARAFVDHNVNIGDAVVIGDDCIISRGTQITNSVILPGVTVGKHLVIQNAIVGNNWMYRTDLGVFTTVAEGATCPNRAA